MATDQSPKLTFREAALRSRLVSERKYEKAASVVGGDDEDAIAASLVQSGIITEYQSQQLRSGRTKLSLGPYLITDFLGQGGMGQVFKAVHSVLGRECAVKVLPLEKSTHESRESFMREIRVQAGLDSPYIVRAFDAGKDGRVHYLATEFVPGTDLRNLVRSNGALKASEAATIISQAALGLQHAHDLGIVHRDVKPGNILVTPDGRAKVSDIGLATWTTAHHDDPRSQKIIGTADFLSPEQVRDTLSVGPLSDIYSLGCTLYYAVTSKVPFPGGDSRSKCRRHCEQTPWHPRKFAPELSEEFVDVVADMMEKDPGQRIQSAAEVAERLEPWVSANEQVVHRPIDRQSWTPPPPPHEPSQLREPPEGPESTNSGSSVSEPSFDTGSIPSLPHGAEEVATVTKSGQLMPIAVALAVAVPISLLIGAIIGFLVRGVL